MPPLPSDLRRRLENAVIAARTIAETGAQAAIHTLAVSQTESYASMHEAQRGLRRGLRAKARQWGEGDLQTGQPLLVHEVAYEQWHRMLFARFLAENHLLMHPAGVAVTLQDCAELAPEEGAADAWELAARYAAAMLPGLFDAANPAVQVRLAPEHRHALEALLQELPAAVFSADNSLGWVYQFWQSKQKDAINASEEKIGGASLGPVTQLFTEDYMVDFLLHNSLGAWWAARRPNSPLIARLNYLRWDESTHQPAAGIFPHWPDHIAQITMLDPTGGSGHFLVAALDLMVPMRMEAEGLDEEAAVRAVLADNLHMLEIDPRCCQIAAFNLLLAAWKRMGYRSDLPVPNIACTGIAVQGQLEDWHKLAGDDQRLRDALTRLYRLFLDAPTLGSLINPTAATDEGTLFAVDYVDVAPLLEQALARERSHDPVAAVTGSAAQGILAAARLLARRYQLVITNVPYLARGKQSETLRDFSDSQYAAAKNDLATVFLARCLDFCREGGATALVLPQNWLFLTTYQALRKQLLEQDTWHLLARLGPGAFETISGEVVKAVLLTLTRGRPPADHVMVGLDVAAPRTAAEKAAGLLRDELKRVAQAKQLDNPDARVALEENEGAELLVRISDSYQGISPADFPRFGRHFWEGHGVGEWIFWQSTVRNIEHYGGRTNILWLDEVRNKAETEGTAYIRGEKSWGKDGIVISAMRELPGTLAKGQPSDTNVAILVPHKPDHLPAIWCYCSSPEYHDAVRQIDQSLKVTNATLVKVPFDLEHWQAVAAARYPNGLPHPYSNDPTQWIFHGHPCAAVVWDEDATWTAHGPLRSDETVLQVAVARLLGYRWPAELDPAMELAAEQRAWVEQSASLLPFADQDGIVCIPPVVGELPAAERLRRLLAHAYSDAPHAPDAGWSPGRLQSLLAAAGFGGKDLEEWLRDGFFQQHCRLFQNRPFLWHIWDGRKDGFAALVNYHKLSAPLLEKLIYTYLGDWIQTQRAGVNAGVAGADGRLVAALALQKSLQAIHHGEAPYDIFVRWKPQHEQPIGWQPDLNDGVRLNIRPFVEAGILRRKFTINWNKDRGRNPDGSERFNDLHLSRAEKEAARQEAARV